uniref:Glycosyl transferase CAP10 domain-containing protein n=1 Tax=Oncorhynchus tshawytscha TaxID=74940 RepID=A0A8C8HC65_ONCTS
GPWLAASRRQLRRTFSVLLGNGDRWQIYLENITKATQQYKPYKQILHSLSIVLNPSSVLNDDLRPFREGVSEELMADTLRRGVGTHYQIINGKLYREHNCMFPARCSGVEHFILQVIDRRDVEMVVNVWDYPQVPGWVQLILPVLSFSKTANYHDIMYPAWTFWEGGPAETFVFILPDHFLCYSQTLCLRSAAQWPWKRKESKGFFRGSRTKGPLVLLSREATCRLNALRTVLCFSTAISTTVQYLLIFFTKDTLGRPPAQEIPLVEHCQYK